MSEYTINVDFSQNKEEDELDYSLDRAWSIRSQVSEIIAKLLAAKIMQTVTTNLSNATKVIIREDTSHLPAHGHVDDILDVNGNSLMKQIDDWHDLYWSAEVDDYVYDLYEIFSHKFVSTEDNIRKLHITI